MKILVDKLPSSQKDCPFADVDYKGRYKDCQCGFGRGTCTIDTGTCLFFINKDKVE